VGNALADHVGMKFQQECGLVKKWVGAQGLSDDAEDHGDNAGKGCSFVYMR
jgi:hypothetical protein